MQVWELTVTETDGRRLFLKDILFGRTPHIISVFVTQCKFFVSSLGVGGNLSGTMNLEKTPEFCWRLFRKKADFILDNVEERSSVKVQEV